MNRRLQVEEVRAGEGTVVRLAGELYSGGPAERLGRRVRRLLLQGERRVTLDLGGLVAMDCGGLGVLLRCRAAARHLGARLSVRRSAGPIRAMLLLAGLLDPLESGAAAPERHGAALRDVPILLSA